MNLKREYGTLKKAKDAALLCNRELTLFYWYSQDSDSWAILRPKPQNVEFPQPGERVPVIAYKTRRFCGYATIRCYLMTYTPTEMSTLVDLDILEDPVSPL